MKGIGIIGFGNMGEALVAGLSRTQPEVRLLVVEKVPERRTAAVDRYGAIDYGDRLGDFSADADIVILAVKPQDLDATLAALAPSSGGRRFISIVAGRTIAGISAALGTDQVCRFMPNLAAKVGRALVGVSFGSGAADAFRRDALSIAAAVGTPLAVDESLMPAVTGISGSGIAYVFSFLHALALGGTKSGLPYSSSLEAALAVLEGAVAAVRAEGEHPIELLSRVTSPAGTTIAGLAELEEGGFTASVMRAVEAASRRAKELEG